PLSTIFPFFRTMRHVLAGITAHNSHTGEEDIRFHRVERGASLIGRLSGSNRHPSAATWIEVRNRHAGSAAVTSPTSRFYGHLCWPSNSFSSFPSKEGRSPSQE